MEVSNNQPMDTGAMTMQPTTTTVVENVPVAVMMFKAPSVAAAEPAAEPET